MTLIFIHLFDYEYKIETREDMEIDGLETATVRILIGEGEFFEVDERVILTPTKNGWKFVKVMEPPNLSYRFEYRPSDGRWSLDFSHTRPGQGRDR